MLLEKGVMKILLQSIVFLILFSGCRGKQNMLVLVLPNGFSGPIVVKSYVTNGVMPAASNGVTKLPVSPNGEVLIRDKSPLLVWHTLGVEYENGEKVIVFQEFESTSNSLVGIRPVPVTRTDENWFVLGTRDDANRLHERLRGFKWPSGK